MLVIQGLCPFSTQLRVLIPEMALKISREILDRCADFLHPAFPTSNPFPYKPWFLCVCSTSLLKKKKKPVRKGKIAHEEQFLIFQQCFLPILRTFCQFRQI